MSAEKRMVGIHPLFFNVLREYIRLYRWANRAVKRRDYIYYYEDGYRLLAILPIAQQCFINAVELAYLEDFFLTEPVLDFDILRKKVYATDGCYLKSALSDLFDGRNLLFWALIIRHDFCLKMSLKQAVSQGKITNRYRERILTEVKELETGIRGLDSAFGNLPGIWSRVRSENFDNQEFQQELTAVRDRIMKLLKRPKTGSYQSTLKKRVEPSLGLCI